MSANPLEQALQQIIAELIMISGSPAYGVVAPVVMTPSHFLNPFPLPRRDPRREPLGVPCPREESVTVRASVRIPGTIPENHREMTESRHV
jgi:hypothetical protein